jgi:hypothetical protein
MNTKAMIEDLFRSFINCECKPSTFCEQFTLLWMQHRDEVSQLKESWTTPQDERLIETFRKNEITKEQFTEQWQDLWGISKDLPFHNLMDAVHSMCSAYNSSPEELWEIGPEQLRRAVEATFNEYHAIQNDR